MTTVCHVNITIVTAENPQKLCCFQNFGQEISWKLKGKKVKMSKRKRKPIPNKHQFINRSPHSTPYMFYRLFSCASSTPQILHNVHYFCNIYLKKGYKQMVRMIYITIFKKDMEDHYLVKTSMKNKKWQRKYGGTNIEKKENENLQNIIEISSKV